MKYRPTGRRGITLARRSVTLLLALTAAASAQTPAARRALREQWFLRGRTLPNQPTAELLHRSYKQKLALRAAQPGPAPQNSGSGWSSLGPAPLASDASGIGEQDYNWVSGRATTVAVDPADPTANTVYLGGAYGGIWKSTNATSRSPGNVVWTPLTDNQATLAIGAIAIQPGGTGVVVAGTGEANSSADSYYGLGILRSPDAGQTWTLISSDVTGTRSFAGMAFSKIAFGGTNSNIAVAATAGASQGIIEGLADPVTANLGLYNSTDSGLTWTYANITDGNVAIDPGSATAVIYNAAANAGAGLFFAALRYHGFYSSSDGLNWQRLANQPGPGLTTGACPPNPHSTACPIYRGEITVVPGRNEMYFWYVDANNNDQGIWTTLDGGSTWIALNESGITNCGDSTGCGTDDGDYNLELAAVPDGGATDLYAGAVNLYKCQITSSEPTCSGTGQNVSLNLTHAYGCSSIARVHPAQHSLAFQLTNGQTQDVMYFANDGGLYRALNAYTGLNTGTCGGSNQFDSLNQTLGSMTQLVSFSQSPTDPNTVLAGAGANGSPATQSALSSSPWLNVNSGDGGNSQINPVDPSQWFVSNPPDFSSGTNIFSCDLGINCLTPDFQNDQVVSSSTVGGDTGPYYPPFLLDPQNSNEMIVGTCRMWRGSSSGSGFTLLSPNFETGGSGVCTGAETNLVRAIAVGGQPANGFSNVIYAGTDGFGPLIPTIPPGGHLWVSLNVAGGSNTWADQTAAINPDSFPISGIALDTSDPTGSTAYVTIMGFGVSHVWQTIDGGITWVDFTANLPDAPANAVLVDPATNSMPGKVYVGTDVGVFSSPTAGANWTEVGPAPNSGNPGFLPNVAVTALLLSVNGSAKLLRASTYGRGLWQFPVTPTFVPTVANTPETVFTNQLPAQFPGTVLFYGYTDSVNLSCQQPLPPNTTCSVQPSSVTPSFPAFNITASGPVGTSAFIIKGVGTDPDQLTATAPFTLNVIDFNLTAPSPNHVTVPPNDTSAPIKFQVTASGPFDQTVNLSCAGLPSGAACVFQPSNAVNPTFAKPVNVVLNITTAANTSPGTFPLTLSGSLSNGPTKTQDLTLTVTADYSLVISNPSLTALETTTAMFNGMLTSLNGYNSPVNLSCGPDAPPICTAAPATVTPTTSGAPFTVTVESPNCGQYNFSILAKGTDPLSTSHSAPVTFVSTSLVPPTFTLSINNSPLTATVGSTATFTGALFATACYGYPVQVSCGSGSPPACTASPKTLIPTVTGAPFTVAVSSGIAQAYGFDIVGVGTDPSAIRSENLVSFTSGSGSGTNSVFTLSNDSGAESVTAGQVATFNLTVAAVDGKLPDPVTLTLTGCPTLAVCTLSPDTAPAGKSSVTIALQVQTSAAVASRSTQPGAFRFLFYSLWLSFPGLKFTLSTGSRSRPRLRLIHVSLALFALLACTLSCGGGLQGSSIADPQPGTTPNTYLMTVTATMSSAPGSPTQNVAVALTVN